MAVNNLFSPPFSTILFMLYVSRLYIWILSMFFKYLLSLRASVNFSLNMRHWTRKLFSASDFALLYANLHHILLAFINFITTCISERDTIPFPLTSIRFHRVCKKCNTFTYILNSEKKPIFFTLLTCLACRPSGPTWAGSWASIAVQSIFADIFFLSHTTKLGHWKFCIRISQAKYFGLASRSWSRKNSKN